MTTELPAYHPSLGAPSRLYPYRDDSGDTVAAVYRFDQADGKTIRPFDVTANAWTFPKVRPLYGLDDLREYPDKPVVLVEGEKCADALLSLGFLATTIMGGCKAVAQADWSPLAERRVIIWPDHDGPGKAYGQDAAKALHEVGAADVRLIDISLGFVEQTLANGDRVDPTDFLIGNPVERRLGPGIDPTSIGNLIRQGWDAADAVEAGFSVEQIARLLVAARPIENSASEDAANDNWPEPDRSILMNEVAPPPFPLSVFPPEVEQFVRRSAIAKSAPPDYVAGALLTACGSLIGTSRKISPWEVGGWSEYPILWTAIVGEPSSNKSPAIDPVMTILRKLQDDKLPLYEEQKRIYEAEKLNASIAHEEWVQETKAARRSHGETQVNAGSTRVGSVLHARNPDQTRMPVEPDPENPSVSLDSKPGAGSEFSGFPSIPTMPAEAMPPRPPTRPRLTVGDCTMEALFSALEGQPKGLLMYRDELPGWLNSFGRYSSGKGGEREFWLEAFNGRPFTVDRVKNGGEVLNIGHLAVSVLGSIQPDKLDSCLLKGDDDGLAARLLYICPNRVPRRAPTEVVDDRAANRMMKRLDGLAMPLDVDGKTTPRVVMLSATARQYFAAWWEADGEADHGTGKLKGWRGKVPGFVLRLALILEYMEWAAGPERPEPHEVGEKAIRHAIALADQYFAPMAERAFGMAAKPKISQNALVIANHLLANPAERIVVRDLYTSGPLRRVSSEEVEDACNELVALDWLKHDFVRRGPNAGRPQKAYLVNPYL
ncbi:DUF3987 domain-containing protein [Pseudokordiimonas caeni]|uniref:DUF3987 domain-containing protein n=1 Tax=Pseudokordiimonas caeni TaxID=2997908 RepID=UPI0028113460|nr:DUF3987 domain-containing protein [Pseudokordiimonas caeni]